LAGTASSIHRRGGLWIWAKTNPLRYRNDCLQPSGLTVTEGAKALGVTRQALNNLVNGKSGISPEMAIRLSKTFGSSPETWLKMQLVYDLAKD
jgi:addiction module HigA family antidote